MIKIFIFTAFVLSSEIALAQGGHVGGGDECERRIKNIRNDIREWILNGGAMNLKLQYGLTVDQDYIPRMLSSLEEGAVQIACYAQSPENRYAPIVVDGIPKTCRYLDAVATGGKPRIECDIERFMRNEPEAIFAPSQYRLIHHEFASLSQIEQSKERDSDYFVSDQVALYIGPQTIWKLGFKRRNLCVAELAFSSKDIDDQTIEKIHRMLENKGYMILGSYRDYGVNQYGVYPAERRFSAPFVMSFVAWEKQKPALHYMIASAAMKNLPKYDFNRKRGSSEYILSQTFTGKRTGRRSKKQEAYIELFQEMPEAVCQSAVFGNI